MSDRIWVAFGCDGEFAPHVGVVISSILRHSAAGKFHFLVMHQGFSAAQKEALIALAPKELFTWIDMNAYDLPEYHVSNHISHATLFRLALEKMAPEDCHRLIYLDADLIVMGDLQELWDQDLNGAALGAIQDAGLSPNMPNVEQHWLDWVDDKDGVYMNAGVLLLDLDQLRRDGGFAEAMEIIAKHGADLPYQDQDAINRVFWNKSKRLPLDWNVQRYQLLQPVWPYLSKQSRAAVRHPKIVHFTGPEKPWNLEGYHPWWWTYWDELARTPFFDEVRETHGITRSQLFQLWLRWLKRRPLSMYATGNFPGAFLKASASDK